MNQTRKPTIRQYLAEYFEGAPLEDQTAVDISDAVLEYASEWHRMTDANALEWHDRNIERFL